jgi:hypothetical protein
MVKDKKRTLAYWGKRRKSKIGKKGLEEEKI